MLIPLDKLLTYSKNKYLLTKALMNAIDKIAFIKDYPEENLNWKVVPNILNLYFKDKIQYRLEDPDTDDKDTDDKEINEENPNTENESTD